MIDRERASDRAVEGVLPPPLGVDNVAPIPGEATGQPSIRAGLIWIAATLALVIGWGALYLWHPSDAAADSICMLRRTTDLPCPGCGIGRGAASLAKGDLIGALRYHPMALALALQGAMIWAGLGFAALGRCRRRLTWVRHLLIPNALMFLAIWLLRLISGTLPG